MNVDVLLTIYTCLISEKYHSIAIGDRVSIWNVSFPMKNRTDATQSTEVVLVKAAALLGIKFWRLVPQAN
jgi:hypothetical protein